MRPSFGDATAERRRLAETAARVGRFHDLLWVEGPGAVGFLQGIITQDVEAMGVGEIRRSFLLAPQGKLRALLWLARGEARVGILTDVGHASRVAEELDHYRIRVTAAIHLDDREISEVWGPAAGEAMGIAPGRWEERLESAFFALPVPGMPQVVVAGVLAPPEVAGIVDLPGVPEVPELLAAGELAATAARVRAGEPVFDRDVDSATIPQETGLVGEAVSFTKGCYLGQELVARIDTRGRVNRHLRRLAIARNVIPPEGAEVWSDDRAVGTITSVTETLTSPAGLGLLRREVEPGAMVTIRWEGGEVPAVVEHRSS